MKRILVLSDTHGDVHPARKALERSLPLDGVIHLGDLLHDVCGLEEDSGLTFWTVAGNNDRYEEEAPEELILDLEGVRIFACHGHLFDLHPHHPRREWKKSFAAMIRRAHEKGAGCVLFGHTHEPFCRRREGMLVMNPGALWEGERKQTYGILTIRGTRLKGAIRRIGKRETENEEGAS